MKRKSKRSVIGYLVAFSVAFAPSAPVWAVGTKVPAPSKAKSKCDSATDGKSVASAAGDAKAAAQAESDAAGTQGQEDAKGKKIKDGAGVAVAAGSQCSGAWAGAAAEVEKCKKKCDSLEPDEKSKCDKPVADALAAIGSGKSSCDALAAGGAATGDGADGGKGSNEPGAGDKLLGPAEKEGGSGMGSMGPLLMGAALGAAAMMLMNKKDKDKDKDKDDADLCSGSKGYSFAECTDAMVVKCGATPTAAGCDQFNTRYCTVGSGTTSTSNPVSSDGDIATSTSAKKTVAPQGEGVGSQFCKTAIAAKFCAGARDGNGDRSLCPSCLQQAAAASSTCQANPIQCLGQNSPERMNAAKQTCPTDPMFSDPNYTSTIVNSGTATGGTVAVGGSTPATTGTGTGFSGSTGASGTGASGSSGSSGSAIGDGTPGPVVIASTGGGSSASGGYATASVGSASKSGARDIASGGGTARSGGSVEIGQQYGPSLFAMSSQVIKARCSQGKLLNCSPY
jgi:hypothetical protein